MVINIVNVAGVTVGKAENNPPVSAHRHRPKTFQRPSERMQPQAGEVHVCNGAHGVQARENVA